MSNRKQPSPRRLSLDSMPLKMLVWARKLAPGSEKPWGFGTSRHFFSNRYFQ
jgi:hypothetical protein